MRPGQLYKKNKRILIEQAFHIWEAFFGLRAQREKKLREQREKELLWGQLSHRG
jgi:hypothetical protein